MRRLDGGLLTAALQARRWTHVELVAELAKHDYVVPLHIARKWMQGKNQPAANRIKLIEQVLETKICIDPPPRREYASISLTSHS